MRNARMLARGAIATAAMVTLTMIPSGTAPATGTARTINGTPTNTKSYPWVAALLSAYEGDPYDAQFCGGTVIAAAWVLTAAHCVAGSDPQDYHVVLGKSTLSTITYDDRREVDRQIVHPQYDAATYANDIALVHLRDQVSIAAPQLWRDTTGPASGTTYSAVGWGTVGPDPYPDQLQRSDAVDAAGTGGTCGAFGTAVAIATMLCAGTASANTLVDACTNDAGGPLARSDNGTWSIVGIASFGFGCGVGNYPGVYTRVSAFASWIDTTLRSQPAGYWLGTTDGATYGFGEAGTYGGLRGTPLNQPVVALAALPSGSGYWLVASDGGIFSFGDAGFHGSTGNIRLNQPIVGMAPTPSGNGYWLVASDGGIFAYGDAGFHGSTGNIRLNQPIVGMAPTPSGNGYWLVASDGGMFAYGDAGFHGSTGSIRLNQSITGMSPTPSGDGYWLVASDGGIFAFGAARFFGSTGSIRLNQPVTGMASTPSGNGYWLVARDGGIFNFGDAPYLGGTGGDPYAGTIVGISRR